MMPHDPRSRSTFPANSAAITTNAIRIERDFRGLVEELGRSIDMLDPSDEELRERLSNTKAVAQRGHRLSKLVLRAIRRRPA